MKKFVFPLAITTVVLALVLVACGARTASAAGSSSNNSAPNANTTPGAANFTQPLPLAESLVVGTIKLQGTNNALDAKTAAALVPLWQAYAQLTSSNTAAQAEIDAVISQIQSTMTPQQTQAITAMKLTRQDLFSTMSSLGLTNGFGGNGSGASGTPRPRTGNGGGGGGGGGFFPGGGGGGFPGGGPGGGTNGTTRPTPNPTQQALRAQFANRIPTALMNALISYLQKTAGA